MNKFCLCFAIFVAVVFSIQPLAFGSGIDSNIYELDKAKKARGINTTDLQETAIKALKFIGGWGGHRLYSSFHDPCSNAWFRWG